MVEFAPPTVESLREMRLFQVFNDTELATLIKVGEVQKYDAYTNIVIEGEMTWGLYMILHGTAGVFKNNPVSGTSHDVGHLEKGNFFGEMSLVDDNPRSATVRALVPCTLFSLSREAFMKFIGENQERKLRFYEGCIKLLVSRLRALNDSYVVSQFQLWKQAFGKKEDAA